jgi:hypothetical protein
LAEAEIEPGAHVFEAKLQGYLGAKEAVQIEKGAAKTIELSLTPLSGADAKPSDPVTAPPANGSVEDGPHKGLLIAGIASSAVAVTGGIVFAILSNMKAARRMSN